MSIRVHSAQARIIEQGIPADGQAARMQLLSKLNIKRGELRGREMQP
jgi:hypothetical protein